MKKILKKLLPRPSSSERWSACSASLWLAAQNGNVSASSKFASRGHDLHQIAFQINSGTRELKESDDEDVKKFVETCREYGATMFEVSVPTYYSKKIQGTIDALAVSPDCVTIIDLKTGMMPASPQFNKQLGIYALSVIKSMKLGKKRKVRIIIVQYGCAEVWETSFSAIEFTLGMVTETIREVRAGKFRYDTTACDFCPAFSLCYPKNKQLLDKLMDILKKDMTTLSEADQLWIIQNASQITKLVESTQARLLSEWQENGTLIAGTGVKQGASVKRWAISDDELVAKYGEAITVKKVMTPASALKKIPDCMDDITISNNKPSIFAVK